MSSFVYTELGPEAPSLDLTQRDYVLSKFVFRKRRGREGGRDGGECIVSLAGLGFGEG